MRKLLVAALALCLVFAFAMPAAATDIKTSGTFFIRGDSQDNPTLNDKSEADSSSAHWIGQRIRATTVFQVEEGLSMTVRYDIAERRWGDDNVVTATDSSTGANTEQQIDFDIMYIQANIGPGVLTAGWAPDDFGLKLGNNGGYSALMKYVAKFGPVEAELCWIKDADGSTVLADQGDSADDSDRYAAGLKFDFGAGYAGAYYIYSVDQSVTTTNKTRNDIRPYVKASIGPVNVEAEVSYLWGTDDPDAGADTDYKGWAYWVNANVAVGPATIGAEYFYVAGDDLTTNDVESNASGLGLGAAGSLIMFNYYTDKWQYSGLTAGKWGSGASKSNVEIYKVYASFKPIEKLTLAASAYFAYAPEKTAAGAGFYDDEYGKEYDITATYKIYKNLDYMVGFGYLSTGDYWKTSTTDKIDDDYLITNQLTLTF